MSADPSPLVAPKMTSQVTSAPAVLVTLASARPPEIWQISAPTSIVRSPARSRTWPAIRLEIANARPNAETTTETTNADSVC
jgi:hypothetical protein